MISIVSGCLSLVIGMVVTVIVAALSDDGLVFVATSIMGTGGIGLAG
jgi:hypothetical protein